MKTVFIFGAGASKQAGAPLMSNFLNCSYDLLRTKEEGVLEAKEEFEEVFSAIYELQGVHAKSYLDLNNIEILFGAIEMGILLKRLGERGEESVNKLRDSLVTLIYKTLECSIKFPVDRDMGIIPPAPYYHFMKIIEDITKNQPIRDPHQFSFITFNYDLCLDYSLYRMSRQYDYCLSTHRPPVCDPLLKLHGSINWGLSEDAEIIPYNFNEIQFDNLRKVPHVYYNLGSLLHTKYYKRKPLAGPPVIVPPTWNKNSYHGQLSNVWAQAAQEFSEAENIFVIGYSLPETDSFFRYLYALGSVSPARLRNLIVINKEKSGLVRDRFEGMIGRGIESGFKYLPKTFSDGIGEIRKIIENP